MDTNPFEMSAEEETALAGMVGDGQVEEQEIEQVAEEVVVEETETGETAAQKTEQKRVKTVPHQALHAEREERKRWEAEARKYQEQMARLDERLRLAAVKEEEIAPPDPEQDPIAAIKYLESQLRDAQSANAERQKQEQQFAQQQQYEQQVVNYATEHVTEYRAENPAYDEAVTYLEKVRADELSLFGLTQQQIHQQIRTEALNLAANCAQRGANVAETIYRMAEVRGFKTKPQTQEAEQKIDTVSRGQERMKSLSNTGGKSAGAEMTVEGLLSLPTDEFDSWCKKNPAKAKALMGG